MKQIYPFATLLLALLTVSSLVNAQTYTGGTYTAVRNGKWHTISGPNVWDPNGEPPSTCNNCLITISTGTTVTLNTSITLAQSSLLQIGTDASAATELLVNGSSGSDFTSSYNVILLYNGAPPFNEIKVASSSSFINAAGASGPYDGIFTLYEASPYMLYYKQVGNAPRGFAGTMETDKSAPSMNTFFGPNTLNSDGTLPIILSDFEASLNSNTVALTWTTSLEVNSDHFVIQRSTNAGANWNNLGTVEAKGFSSLPVNYAFSDATPVSGADQYRLQLVDKDGTYTYSDIKVVRVGAMSKVKVFPNPAIDNVNVTLGDGSNSFSGSVRLYSQSGQLLTERNYNNIAGGTTISLSVSTYPAGSYMLVVAGTDGSQLVTKLMLTK